MKYLIISKKKCFGFKHFRKHFSTFILPFWIKSDTCKHFEYIELKRHRSTENQEIINFYVDCTATNCLMLVFDYLAVLNLMLKMRKWQNNFFCTKHTNFTKKSKYFKLVQLCLKGLSTQMNKSFINKSEWINFLSKFIRHLILKQLWI